LWGISKIIRLGEELTLTSVLSYFDFHAVDQKLYKHKTVIISTLLP